MSKDRFTLRSAVYLILLKGNQILLLRRSNTGWMDGKYSLISGHLDGNESVTQAIIREAKEEATIDILPQDLIPATVLHSNFGDYEYIDFFFIAKKWQGDIQIGEPDKCSELAWYDQNNLPQDTLPFIKQVIHNYENKIPFSPYGWD